MPHSAASDLGLHCLPMSHKKDARLIWVSLNVKPFKVLEVKGFEKSKKISKPS